MTRITQEEETGHRFTERGVGALAARRAVASASSLRCGSDDNSSSSSSSGSSSSGARPTRSRVLLPDTKSSVRWETVDRPLLKKAFKKAGVPSKIQNAQGDKSTQQQQAEQAITNGAKVLLLVEPRLGLRRRDRGERQVAAASRSSTTTASRSRATPTTTSRSTTSRSASCRARASSSAWASANEPADRRAQRLADRQQRHAVQAGLQLGPQPAVQVGQAHQGRRPVRARLGQPEGADDLRADAAEGLQQDRRRARGQRRPRQRGDLGAEGPQAQADPGHRPGRDARRASRTSSPATSA